MKAASISLILLSAFAQAECPTLFPMVDIHVCAGGAAILSPAVEGKFKRLEWNKLPGFLEDKGGFVFEYTPDSSETEKEVKLTLTAYPESGCPTQVQSVTLHVDAMPEVKVSDIRLCEGTPIIMDPQVLSVYDSLRWKTSGSGKYLKPSEPVTPYEPSEMDVKSDGVDLTVSVYHGVCPVAEASLHLIIDEKPKLTLQKKSIKDAYSIQVLAPNGLEYQWKTNGQGKLLTYGNRVEYFPVQGESGTWVSVSTQSDRGCESTSSLWLNAESP